MQQQIIVMQKKGDCDAKINDCDATTGHHAIRNNCNATTGHYDAVTGDCDAITGHYDATDDCDAAVDRDTTED